MIPVHWFRALQVANRRLFTVVREERQLTYDASFVLQNRDVLEGGFIGLYCVLYYVWIFYLLCVV